MTSYAIRLLWPTKTQLIKSACIVMLASVIIALIIFIMDQVVDNIMHLIYSLGK